MKYFVAILLMLMLSVIACAEDWAIIESDHFLVRYTQNLSTAGDIQNIAENFFPQVTDEIGYSIGRKIDIWFCETRKEFERTVNAPIQDWAAGCAYPLQARIVLLDPALSEDRRIDLARIVEHEITHVVFGLYVRENLKNVPRWFNEGVAMYVSDDWGYSNYWTILTGTLGNNIIPLFNISEDFPESAYQARLAYAESCNIIMFMVKRYGNDALKGCIRELAKGRPFDEALASATGVNIDWLESRWMKELKKRYKWYYLLSSSIILWGGAILILSIGLIRRKVKNQRTIKEWEEEDKGIYWSQTEGYEPEIFDYGIDEDNDEDNDEDEFDDDDESKEEPPKGSV
jgi:hypothetical protein